MKRIKLLIIPITLILILTLVSCSFERDDALKIPKSSDNFSEDFMDSFLLDYSLSDPHLYYFTASPIEVNKYHNLGNLPNGAYDLYLARIDDLPKEQFVAVADQRDKPTFEGYGSVFVYQRYDAPVPMRDFTVSSVSVLESIAAPDQDVQVYDLRSISDGVQNYLDTFFKEENTIIYAEYTAEEHPTIVSDLQSAYSKAIPLKGTVRTGEMRPWHSMPNNGNAMVSCYLLFKFEETDNLVWMVDLVKRTENEETNYYYFYSYYDVTPKTNEDGKEYLDYEKKKVLAPISPEVAEILMANIE